MPKDFAGEIRFDQPVDVVFAAQRDPDYVTWKHENMAAFDISAEVTEEGDTVRVTSTRSLPAKIPSAAKKFVGESITITEVHTWSPPEPSGIRKGKVTASFGGAPMSVDGELELAPDGSGSVIRVSIRSSASVPLVGGKLEKLVGDQFLVAMNKEQRIAPQWFAEHA